MNGRSRILIVDDNPRNVLVLQKLLKDYTLCVTTTGEDALAKVVEFQPELVLLDIMMPGIDGYETCRRLRANRDLPVSPKVIMVSAKAMLNERLLGYEAGADDYVTKPFDQDELLAKVKVYLRLSSLEQMERFRDNLVTLLSHETSTPISSLIGAADLLLNPALSPSDRAELVEIVSVSSHRLHALIGKIVMLSMLRSGAMVLHRETVSLQVLARAATDQKRAEAAGRSLALDCVVEADFQAALDNRFACVVLGPILENAIQHTQAGGSITLRIGPDPAGGGFELSVSDTGHGIASELLPQIARGFVVGDLQHHHRGTGLSLTLADQFVKSHDGRLEIQSEPGRGTTVRIRMPAAADSEGSVRAAA